MHCIALFLVRLCFAALYRYRLMLFFLLYSLRCEMPQKEQVRMNLVSSLAAAQITFLSGIESTDNQVGGTKSVCTYVRTYVRVCVYVCMYICMYVCM